MPRHLLVVATAAEPNELRERVRRYAGEDVEVLVVAPASDVSLLDLLTGGVDEARREAEGVRSRWRKPCPRKSSGRVSATSIH
jgi:hypothetical protein